MASVGARGRGIGRGRGGFGVPKAQTRPGETADEHKNGSSSNTVAEEFDLQKLLSDLKEVNVDDKVKKLTTYISSSDSPTKIKQVVDNLGQKTMKDSEFAPLAATAANKLCSEESCGSAFRSCLLKTTQENYKKRESIREKSKSEWIGLVSLICELFNRIRTGQTPLKPLAGAVYQTMSELLREGDTTSQEAEEDEIDCFYQQFKTVGKLLETTDRDKMDELVGKIRDTILAVGATAKTRCLLLELLELRTCQWSLNSDVERFYSDTLADIMAKEI